MCVCVRVCVLSRGLETGAQHTESERVCVGGGKGGLYLKQDLNPVSQAQCPKPLCQATTCLLVSDFAAGPTIVYHSDNVTAHKGETVVLGCYVNGNPPPSVTWWMRTPGETEAYVQKGEWWWWCFACWPDF